MQASGRSGISRRGGVDPRLGRFLVKMYVKTKELGPIGGRAPDTPPRSASASTRIAFSTLRNVK